MIEKCNVDKLKQKHEKELYAIKKSINLKLSEKKLRYVKLIDGSEDLDYSIKKHVRSEIINKDNEEYKSLNIKTKSIIENNYKLLHKQEEVKYSEEDIEPMDLNSKVISSKNTINSISQASSLTNTSLLPPKGKRSISFSPLSYSPNIILGGNKANPSELQKLKKLNQNIRKIHKIDKIYDSFDDDEEDELTKMEEEYGFLSEYLYPSDKYNIFLLNPSMLGIKIWNIIGLVIILYLNIYQFSILSFNLTYRIDYSYYFLILIELYFTVNMFLNFRTSFYSREVLIENKQAIVMNYLASEFLSDLLQIIPINTIYLAMYYYSNRQLKSFHLIFIIFRFIQNFSPFKIIRIIRKIVSLKDIFVNTILALLIFHSISCSWVLMAKYLEYKNNSNWISYYNFNDKSELEIYLSSLYFILVTLFTAGYGDIVPISLEERLFVIILLFFGYLVFSLTLSSFSTKILYQSQLTQKYLTKKNILSQISTEYGLSHDIETKIKLMLKKNYNNSRFEHALLFESLSNKLRNELLFSIQTKLKKDYLLFRFLSKNVIVKLMNKLVYMTINKNEIISQNCSFINEVYIIQSGYFSFYLDSFYEGFKFASIKDGNSYGEYHIFKQTKIDYLIKTSALLNHVMILSRDDFFEMKNEHEAEFDVLIHNSFILSDKIETKARNAKIFYDQNKSFDGFIQREYTTDIILMNDYIEEEFNYNVLDKKYSPTESDNDYEEKDVYETKITVIPLKTYNDILGKRIIKKNEKERKLKKFEEPAFIKIDKNTLDFYSKKYSLKMQKLKRKSKKRKLINKNKIFYEDISGISGYINKYNESFDANVAINCSINSIYDAKDKSDSDISFKNTFNKRKNNKRPTKHKTYYNMTSLMFDESKVLTISFVDKEPTLPVKKSNFYKSNSNEISRFDKTFINPKKSQSCKNLRKHHLIKYESNFLKRKKSSLSKHFTTRALESPPKKQKRSKSLYFTEKDFVKIVNFDNNYVDIKDKIHNESVGKCFREFIIRNSTNCLNSTNNKEIINVDENKLLSRKIKTIIKTSPDPKIRKSKLMIKRAITLFKI